MPKPIAVAVRQQIIERHQAGESLAQISRELRVPYESSRNVWRVYRQTGRIAPNYAACGRRVQASRRVYRAALYLKRRHPTWGAVLIRQLIGDKWSEEAVPHARSLQRWFRQAGLNPPRPVLGQARRGRGREAHNVWEMDSREGITLSNGEKVIWLLVSDEASGAVLGGEVFPHGPRQPIGGG
jgi:transposase